jgi:recombination protein RecT
MSVRTQSNGQIVPKSQQQQQRPEKPGAIQLVERYKAAIEQALPRHINGDRMMRVVVSSFRTNPKLLECTGGSLIGSILQASQLGLEPNTPLGHCYMIPYGKECQLVIGYQGMIELSVRSGLVSGLYAQAVYEGDVFDYQLGTEPKIVHKPTEQSDTLTHVYAVARLKGSDEPVFTVLPKVRVEEARSRSASANKSSSPWKTDYTAMALKTAVRRLWKWLPKSPEMATSVALDEAIEQARSQSIAWDGAVLEAVEAGGETVDTEGQAPESSPDPAAGNDGHPEPGADG